MEFKDILNHVEENKKKFLDDELKKSLTRDSNRYKCWDCEKELGDLHFDDELKKKCPIDMDGFLRVICNDCKDNDDY